MTVLNWFPSWCHKYLNYVGQFGKQENKELAMLTCFDNCFTLGKVTMKIMVRVLVTLITLYTLKTKYIFCFNITDTANFNDAKMHASLVQNFFSLCKTEQQQHKQINTKKTEKRNINSTNITVGSLVSSVTGT